jgi:hypothetical protein
VYTRDKNMKKIILVVLMTITTAAFAQPGHFRHGHHHGGHWQRGHNSGWVWMVPAIIGGAIVYEASRQQPPQTVIIQQQSLVDTNCSPWTETQNPDGTITRTRTCTK